MASRSRRRATTIGLSFPKAPRDERPIGPLLLGDPSTSDFSEFIHPFPEMDETAKKTTYGPSPDGIKGVDKRSLKYHDPMRSRREEED